MQEVTAQGATESNSNTNSSDSDAPVLSIIVPVYNHGRYIRECLEGIAKQKCTYPFEVLIGEDCSPDNSREVLKELEKELPDNFIFLYREENMNGKPVDNSADLVNRCRGKYYAACEGDDFWTYEYKLQEQLDFLESHPDYVACYHHCTVVGEDSQPNGERYPECLDDDYSFHEYFLFTMPGQFGTFMTRYEPYVQAKANFLSCQCYDKYASDRRNAFFLLTTGKIRCIQEEWSAYRHITASGTSHSATFHYSKEFAHNEINFGKTLVDYAKKFGNAEAQWIALQTYYRARFRWCHGKNKVEKLSGILKDIGKEERKLGLLTVPLRWYGTLAFRVLRGRSIIL